MPYQRRAHIIAWCLSGVSCFTKDELNIVVMLLSVNWFWPLSGAVSDLGSHADMLAMLTKMDRMTVKV